MTRRPTQRVLFGPGSEPPTGLVRHDHPETSRASAREAGARIGAGRLAVLRALADGGKTDDEIREATGLSLNGHRARRVECVDAGLVEDSGAVVRSAYGRPATLWRLTDAGRRVVAEMEEQ